MLSDSRVFSLECVFLDLSCPTFHGAVVLVFSVPVLCSIFPHLSSLDASHPLSVCVYIALPTFCSPFFNLIFPLGFILSLHHSAGLSQEKKSTEVKSSFPTYVAWMHLNLAKMILSILMWGPPSWQTPGIESGTCKAKGKWGATELMSQTSSTGAGAESYSLWIKHRGGPITNWPIGYTSFSNLLRAWIKICIAGHATHL